MASDDQDILAKISQLAGQINRHKNGQPSDQQTQFMPTPGAGYRGDYSQASAGWRPSRGAYTSRGYTRGGRAQVHRNRTLVLNGTTNENANPNSDNPDSANGNTTPGGWVVKNDRHRQLINTSVFEKETQNRAKAMEETRRQKLRQRNDLEKSKLNKHLQRLRGNNFASSHPAEVTGNYEIDVQGIRFRVAKNGSKLVKVPGDLNSAKSTPKDALVGGVRFHRSKNGNLVRSSIIKAQRTGVIKKIDEPCQMFTTTGSCTKGPKCRYIHDPSKVAVCKDFLLRSCPSGDSCDLSHDLIPQRTPTCLHFAKGNCSNPNCRYTHVRVSSNAPVCNDFGIYGYCEKGLNCEERHVHECPDFSNTGKCTRKGCKLPHRYKASVMRTASVEEENSDVSSDEDDEEIDSDDVDSDGLDEESFGDDDGIPDSDIPTQQNYVQLS